MPRPRAWIVFTLFFLSGATGLVYEVLWLRQLILIFGSTLYATSTILSTFMGGLALGAFLGGRWYDRRERNRPLVVYGGLELLIGAYALLVPLLFGMLTPLYRRAWAAGADESFLVLSLVKFFGIAVVLLPPTIMMGASLPILAREVAADLRRVGGDVGVLYATNTFGAVVGTFSAGFLLIPSLGVRATTWLTAATSAAIGLVALAAAGGRAPAPAAQHPSARLPASEESMDRKGSGWVLLAFGASGFCAMVLEVAWTRGLVLVLGSSVYAFALMLVAFLIGLAGGGAAFSAWLRRRPGVDLGLLFAGLLCSAALLTWATAFALQHLPELYGRLFLAWRPGPEALFMLQLGFGLLLMFPATFALGGIFPVVLQTYAGGGGQVSRSVGTVYASNTAGTILGAAASGFFLVPALGVRDSIVMTAVVQGGLAVVIALTAATRSTGRSALLIVGLLAASLPLAVRPGWDALLMNSGVYMNIHDFEDRGGWKAFKASMSEDVELIYVREGMSASVLVADEPRIGNRFLAVNGKIEASTNADMETQLACAHVPLLLHDDPRDVLVIGLASGITAGSAATHPIESLRVLEVERAVVPAARLFAEQNYDVLDDRRLTLSINDARNELEFSDATYDIIISEPSNPWMTVASNLFTEDFFRMAAGRLRQGGMFSQWLQSYYLAGEDLRSVVAAFRAAFPHVMVFEMFDGVDLLLLGSREPLRLDLDRIDRRISELAVRMDLARIGVDSASDLLPLFRMGPREVDRFTEGAGRNTDDNARVEFSAPRTIGTDTLDANIALIDRYAGDPLAYLSPAIGDPEDADRARLELVEANLRRRRLDRAEAQLDSFSTPAGRAEAEALIQSMR